jgi:hypothetical protein
MIGWIVNKWDWMIYRLAHHSIRRMCERDPAFAYLFELWIREWRSKHPIPDYIERSTERFFEAVRSLNQTGESDENN